MDALTINEAAETTGWSPRMLRYVERVGLLEAKRSAAGYRLYPGDVIQRLAVIRRAQQFGFSLREIAAFLRVREGGGRPCQQVRDAAERLLTVVDAQIAELTARRRRMLDTLRGWDQALAHTRDDRRAHLLEMLPEASERRSRARPGGLGHVHHRDATRALPRHDALRREPAISGGILDDGQAIAIQLVGRRQE